MAKMLNFPKEAANEIAASNSELDKVKIIEDLLNTTYEWVNKGIPDLVEPIADAANEYSKKCDNPEEAAKALIRTHIKWSATAGFVTGLGGAITLPVTLPADMISVTILQLRMVAGVAKLGGYDLNDSEVKTFILSCLTGQALSSVLKDTGINAGEKIAIAGIKKIPGEVIKKINQRVGFRLLTKFGETGVINIGKAVPIVGGVIGGGFDAATTAIIAKNAYSMFISGYEMSGGFDEMIGADVTDDAA